MATLATESLDTSKQAACVLAEEKIKELLADLEGWSLINVQGVPRVEKAYSFKDFQQALAFTNRVGALAEDVGHHPALLTEWGKVTVTWWSHSLGGIHRNDMIMAARTERLSN
ncbi:4a-hydroxytetrahydrobiopterin dehydratase [uncultured Halopseudomonas sp.]|jgi:4a-hydroxytetrahydrobiopterin dehydratase|uniref:4a-hydroxytetrahydrobiopterin dehydratase n=1 Tax=uncultured Halopseudomonas sp. TaxID=2901193 RepID=UPI0030EE9DDF|tara:strand:+ start:15714 stop:16052 length:339 start_codon:yes stop_codon:yes gene_type:complete